MTGLSRSQLGRTGLQVSRLGFGASPLGNVFGNVKLEDGIAAVHEAARLGINFFDVSPYYGDTLAEQVLGKALQSMPVARDKYVLSSKCGRYGNGVFHFSAERVVRSVEETLHRLNVEYLDIIQVHDIEFGDLSVVVSDTIPALQKLKEAGKVRFIGITGLPLNIFSYVLDRVQPGSVDVVLSYCHYSLNDTSLEDCLPYFKEKGVGVINASPLSMGLLTDQGAPEWHPAPLALKTACAAATAHCQSKGKNISKLALQFSLRNPDIATTLVGMCSVEQVRQNYAAALEAENEASIDYSLLHEVQSILSLVKNVSWPSGRPENN